MTVILTVAAMLTTYGSLALGAEGIHDVRHGEDTWGTVGKFAVSTLLAAAAIVCLAGIHP